MLTSGSNSIGHSPIPGGAAGAERTSESRKGTSMKKILILFVSIVITLAAAYTGTAWWSGMMVEKEFYQLLKNNQNAGCVSLSTSNYHRSIFRSEAVTTVEVRIPETDGSNTSLFVDLTHDIAHGPWPVGSSLSELSLLRPVLAIIDTRILSKPQTQTTFCHNFTELLARISIRDRTILYLRGNGTSHLTAGPFRGTFGKDGVSVHLRQTTLNTSFSAGFDTLKSTLTFPQLEACSTTGHLIIKDTVIDMDMHRVVVDFYLGNASFKTALIKIEGAGQETTPSFTINNLTMTSSSRESNTLFNTAVRVSFDELLTDGTKVGPVMFTMEGRNLDTASMVLLQNSCRQMQHKRTAGKVQDIDQMILNAYMEVLPRMLRESPQLEITQLSVSTAEGDARGKALVSVDGTRVGPTFNPLLLAGALSVEAEFSATEHLLQRVFEFRHTHLIENEIRTGTRPTLSNKKLRALAARQGKRELATLIKQHVLTRKDNNMTINASYRRGQVTVNGRPLPLENLLRQNAL